MVILLLAGLPAAAETPTVEPAVAETFAQLTAATAGENGRSLALVGLTAHLKAAPVEVLPQVLFLRSRVTDERVAAATAAAIARAELPAEVQVRALAPWLETEDAAFAGAVRGVLTGCEQRSADRRPDFSQYRALIAERLRAGEALPRGLVDYMFAADAGEALLALQRAHQVRDPERIREVLWAERQVSELFWKRRHGFVGPRAVEPAAMAELERLARHEAWWARRYVVAVLAAAPELGSEELVGMLAGDGHPWVRAAALGLPLDGDDGGD